MKYVVRSINISSDGSQETDTVIFSNAAFISNAAKGQLMKVEASGSSCKCLLEWDQTTDVPICAFDPSLTQCLDFTDVGGFANPNGSGATGDLLLTTTGLASGALVTLKITVKQA